MTRTKTLLLAVALATACVGQSIDSNEPGGSGKGASSEPGDPPAPTPAPMSPSGPRTEEGSGGNASPPGMQPTPTPPAPAEMTPPDAEPPSPGTVMPPATDPPAEPEPPAADPGNYTCTLIFGINATAEWYNRGFENLVDGSKWQLIRVHSGFVEKWADPNSDFWNARPTSACAQNADSPDRIIFVALNFDFTSLEQWLPPMAATTKNLIAKYPSAKRIELGTYVRAPGNKPCPQGPPKRSTIPAAEDQAIEMVVAQHPGLVFAAPKFEAKTCSEFSGNPPHPNASGGMAWAKMIAEHYGSAAK